MLIFMKLFGCKLFGVFVKKLAPQVSCRNPKNSLEIKVKLIVLELLSCFCSLHKVNDSLNIPRSGFSSFGAIRRII